VDLVKFTQVTLNVVQAVALVAGGLWVYFKFARGRTFARRADLHVEAALLSIKEHQVIRVKVALKSTGLSKIPLKAHRQVLTLWATSTSDFSPGANFTWKEWMISEIFKADQYVEAQEAIKDEALLPVAPEGGPWLAFRIRVEVRAEPYLGRFGRTRWATNIIIPAQLDEAVPTGP
jgi:hypothetical protein